MAFLLSYPGSYIEDKINKWELVENGDMNLK
jgi:hypothetical protein